MLLVDTNALVDVLEDDPEWADWSTHQLQIQSKNPPPGDKPDHLFRGIPDILNRRGTGSMSG